MEIQKFKGVKMKEKNEEVQNQENEEIENEETEDTATDREKPGSGTGGN